MISVIMSTYKEEEYMLRQSIESILNQTYSDFEYIIILDFPENEDHKRIIREYMDQDSRIRFYINEKNLGLTGSLNRGLNLATGEYIARMDADDISVSNRLEKQLEYLKKNDFDLIGGVTQIIDEYGEMIYSVNKVPSDFNKIKKALKYGTCLAHPTWFGKKSCFDDLNGYRNIPLCEDSDFVLRAVLSGKRVSNINEIVLRYRMTSNSISRNNLFEQYLYMRYITNAYKKGNVADVEDAKKYVLSQANHKSSEKYLRANVIFNRMLKEMTDKKWMYFIVDGFKLLFASRYYLNKIYRFMMLTLNS